MNAVHPRLPALHAGDAVGNEALLKGVFMSIGGLDDAAASAIVDAIVDWRDGDDLRRPSGAESGDYRAANSNYTPANANFETVGEMSRVLGVTPHPHFASTGSSTSSTPPRRAAPTTASAGSRSAATPPAANWYW